MNKNVGFLLFETIHGKKDIGSSRIRGHWLIKYWPEAENFQFGKKYDAVIYQKAYPYEAAEAFPGVKILDMCDPDWLDHYYVKRMADTCDYVTTSTESLAEGIRTFTNTPTVCVPDRIDFAEYLLQKKHTKKAEWVVWFGYSHNSEVLQYAMNGIQKRGMKLAVVSDANNFRDADRWVQYPKTQAEFNTLMQEFDMAVFPVGHRPRDRYKSNNKTIIAWANGLPVAQFGEDMDRFMDPAERTKEMVTRAQELKDKWDVKQSVQEMKDIIRDVQKK